MCQKLLSKVVIGESWLAKICYGTNACIEIVDLLGGESNRMEQVRKCVGEEEGHFGGLIHFGVNKKLERIRFRLGE